MFGGGFNNKKLSTQINTDESGLILVQSYKPSEQLVVKERVKLTLTETNLDSESKHTDLMAHKEDEYPDRKFDK